MWKKVSLKSREVAQCPCWSEHMMEAAVSIQKCGERRNLLRALRSMMGLQSPDFLGARKI